MKFLKRSFYQSKILDGIEPDDRDHFNVGYYFTSIQGIQEDTQYIVGVTYNDYVAVLTIVSHHDYGQVLRYIEQYAGKTYTRKGRKLERVHFSEPGDATTPCQLTIVGDDNTLRIKTHLVPPENLSSATMKALTTYTL